MAHARKSDFVFPRNGLVHLNRWGRQFSRLLAAVVWASAWVMLDIPRSEVAWEYWLPTPFDSFPFTSPPVRHRVPPGSERALFPLIALPSPLAHRHVPCHTSCMLLPPFFEKIMEIREGITSNHTVWLYCDTVGYYLLYINTRVTKYSTWQTERFQKTCPTPPLVQIEYFSFIFNIYDVLNCGCLLPCEKRSVLHIQRYVGV